MLGRCFDAGIINATVNHPDVRPYVGGDVTQPLDLSAAIEQPRNVFLMGEHGGFGLSWCAPHTYEVHTFIVPNGRGRWALAATREGIATMRDEYGADRIWTRVADDHLHTKLFTRAAGMKPAGEMAFDLGVGPTLYKLYEWRA